MFHARRSSSSIEYTKISEFFSDPRNQKAISPEFIARELNEILSELYSLCYPERSMIDAFLQEYTVEGVLDKAALSKIYLELFQDLPKEIDKKKNKLTKYRNIPIRMKKKYQEYIDSNVFSEDAPKAFNEYITVVSNDMKKLEEISQKLKDQHPVYDIESLINNLNRWLIKFLNTLQSKDDVPQGDLQSLRNGLLKNILTSCESLSKNLKLGIEHLEFEHEDITSKIASFITDIQTIIDFRCFVLNYDYKEAECNRTPLGNFANNVITQFVSKHEENENKEFEIFTRIYRVFENFNNARAFYDRLKKLNQESYSTNSTRLRKSSTTMDISDSTIVLFRKSPRDDLEDLGERAKINREHLLEATDATDKALKSVRNAIHNKIASLNENGLGNEKLIADLNNLKNNKIQAIQLKIRKHNKAYNTLALLYTKSLTMPNLKV